MLADTHAGDPCGQCRMGVGWLHLSPVHQFTRDHFQQVSSRRVPTAQYSHCVLPAGVGMAEWRGHGVV